MKLKMVVPALMLGMCSALYAQGNCAGINLSLWKDISTQRFDSARSTYLNVGLVSVMGNLDGIGVNAIGSAVKGHVNGVQLSGLANVAGNGMHGVQLSAAANVARNDAAGVMVSGLTNVAANRADLFMASGLANIAASDMNGVAVCGLINFVDGGSKGALLSGMANVSGASYGGVMVSGLLNLTCNDFGGVQLTPLINVVGDTMRGGQIGLLNYATNGHGLQLGLLNYYRKDFKGLQLGLANINPDTRVQMMLFGGNSTKINLGARFRNRMLYTIVGVGTHYLDFDDKFSAAAFYRCGLWTKLCKALSLSGDLGYQHIETFANRHYGVPARLYALQARLNLECKITDKLAIMASGGYGGSRYYNRAATYDKGAIVEAGVVLF